MRLSPPEVPAGHRVDGPSTPIQRGGWAIHHTRATGRNARGGWAVDLTRAAGRNARPSGVVAVGQVAGQGQLRETLGLDELVPRRRPGGELERHDPAPLGSERRLHAVGKNRPGGGSPQVIGAVELEQAVLVHVAADNQRCPQQAREAVTAWRGQEPVRRRAGQLGAGRGYRLVREEGDPLVLATPADLVLEP